MLTYLCYLCAAMNSHHCSAMMAAGLCQFQTLCWCLHPGQTAYQIPPSLPQLLLPFTCQPQQHSLCHAKQLQHSRHQLWQRHLCGLLCVPGIRTPQGHLTKPLLAAAILLSLPTPLCMTPLQAMLLSNQLVSIAKARTCSKRQLQSSKQMMQRVLTQMQ